MSTLYSDVITVRELCEWLRISKGMALKLLNTGQIPARKTGAQWRIHKDEAENWLRQGEQDTKEAPTFITRVSRTTSP